MDTQDFGGLGDITLSMFQDPLEQMQLRHILPLGIKITRATLQVLVGSRNQPDIRLDGLVPFDALESLFLDHAESLGLHRRSHISDFLL